MPDNSLFIPNACVNDAGQRAGDAACAGGRQRRDHRMHVMHQQHGCDGRAERDRSVGGDVGELEHAEADEDTERQQGQDQPDGEGADEQRHRSSAPIQQAPRVNSLCPTPVSGRFVVQQVQDALHGLLVEERADRFTEHEPSLLEGPERKRGGVEVAQQRPVVVERAELADVAGARGALHDAGDERESSLRTRAPP
jgi:hypothetical protein